MKISVKACIVDLSTGRLVVQERDENARVYKGHLTLIGGDPKGNETPEECNRRESKEETGLTPKSSKLLGYIDINDGQGKRFFYFLSEVDNKEGLIQGEGRILTISRAEYQEWLKAGKVTPIMAQAIEAYDDHLKNWR
ncbi:MAG: hypothetical protein COY40_03265 [Alphaproteobacteria bacterium CG_4_10_14_0_8_um_filter_53_9]|nr:MAG: hypothetical protein COY40_03265 [Alphaproteobacteria bacterium CG_4_10_14_0_8_um_filter_53_9]